MATVDFSDGKLEIVVDKSQRRVEVRQEEIV